VPEQRFTPEQMQAMQALMGVPPEPAFNFAPEAGGGAAQVLGMMGLAPAITRAGDVASDLWQGLFGDPRITQASVPDPKAAMARMIQMVQHLGKTGVRGSRVIPNLERNMQMIMKGQQGEKAVLELGDEFMDLVNIGAKKGVAPEFWQSLDDTAEILGKQLRRGHKTPTTPAAKASIESGVQKGHLVPGGEYGGWLSTKQPLGRRLLEQQTQGAVMDPDLVSFLKTFGGQ
jgi:hypothetical protein